MIDIKARKYYESHLKQLFMGFTFINYSFKQMVSAYERILGKSHKYIQISNINVVVKKKAAAAVANKQTHIHLWNK